ncbi:MAG TPA: adenosine deaminase [Galbitalea sp.]|jgi:adenosine deaminase|nr:adenosine deaminase [Galbitalea sp.]
MSSSGADFILPIDGTNIVDLPKVSLHDHLDGGLRTDTILELADAIGLEMPAGDPEALQDWFDESCDSGDLVDYLKTFDLTIAVMQTADNLHRVAREFVQDLGADGVIYGEIRWAPEQHLKGGLSLDDAVEAVQAGLDAGVRELRAAGHDIRVGQLVSAMRHLDRGLEIAQLAVRHRDRGVVGFDIAGPENGFPPSNLREAFDYLAREYMPCTVHAGEAAGLASIESALFDGRAMRLGHGVRIAEDIVLEREDEESSFVALGPVAQWVKDREIVLETSPSSNLQTGTIEQWGDDMIDHPFDLLYQLGFAVTVNTDNRLMSNTSLSRELAILSETFGYDMADIEVFQLNAAAGAFLSYEDREELTNRILQGFGRV